jgi:signal peptidase I
MERIEKCKLAIKKGITYNEITGDVIGVKGNVLKAKDNQGYICFGIWHENYTHKLYGHQFAWFVMYNECVPMIDHKNQIKTDNSKKNLRNGTRQLNSLNRNSSGVTYDKKYKKWVAQIMVDGKNNNLGRFDLKENAQNKYEEFKECLIKKITK